MTDTFDFGRFEALTFDCYGTLIDWETGLATALRRLLGPAGAAIDTDALLETYAGFEAAAERPPYRTYREVLAIGGRGVAAAAPASSRPTTRSPPSAARSWTGRPSTTPRPRWPGSRRDSASAC